MRKQIEKWVKDIERFKTKDPECKALLHTIRKSGDEIGIVYGKIHNETYASPEEYNELTLKISELSHQKRDAETKYTEILTTQFSDFKNQYEKIFELAISEEGIDPATLKSVLDVFEKYRKNEINQNQGVNMGIDFMTTRYKLPSDFLNKLPEN